MLQVIWIFSVAAVAPTGTIGAHRTNEAPVIDGSLDDAVWHGCTGETCDLWQFAPDYGSSMTQPTTIRVLYDDTRIYFGFVLKDTLPDRMIEALTPRDNYINGEWIAVILDTWSDGRSAFSFEVSLANSQMDSRLNEHGGWDYGWDAVWESGTTRLSDGWSAELSIPLSCLRFPDRTEQTWSVNFQRILSRTSENGWYMLSGSERMADLDDFAPITGISGVEGSLGLEIRPYAAGRYYDFRTGEDEGSADAGIDVKMGLTSGITADFTLNPDFGQIEADEAEMNLGHFELFLEERRPFFMERSELFDMPFNMFYSRRIGAAAWNGDLIPILGGAKISGSFTDGFSFGFIDAVTGRVWESDSTLAEPGANYGIFRGIRQFGGYSFLGLSGVSRDAWAQEGQENESNRAFALDGAIELPGNHVLSGSMARSWNTGVDDEGAYSFGFEKVRSTLNYWVNSSQVDQGFDVNGTGYTTYTGFRDVEFGASKTYRPEHTFSTLSIWANHDYTAQMGGETLQNCTHAEVEGSFKNGWNFNVSGEHNGDYFDPYEGPEGRFYGSSTSYFVGGGSNPYYPLRFWAGNGGGQYNTGGTFSNFTGSVRYLPVPVFETRLAANWFRTFDTDNYNWEAGAFDTRSTDWRSLTLRLAYMFNTDMNLRLFSQYSSFTMDYLATGATEGEELRSNLLYAWQYLPGSMLYLLGETVFEGNGDGGFSDPDLGVYAKVTWFLPV